MQGVGVAGAGATRGGMIFDHEDSAPLRCLEQGLVDHRQVRRAETLVVQIVVILRNPDEVERLRRDEILGRGTGGPVLINNSGIVIRRPELRRGTLFSLQKACSYIGARVLRRFRLRAGRNRDGVDMSRLADGLAEDPGEISIAWHEVRDLVTRLDAGESDDRSGVATRVAFTVRVRSLRVRDRFRNVSRYRARAGSLRHQHRSDTAESYAPHVIG